MVTGDIGNKVGVIENEYRLKAEFKKLEDYISTAMSGKDYKETEIIGENILGAKVRNGHLEFFYVAENDSTRTIKKAKKELNKWINFSKIDVRCSYIFFVNKRELGELMTHYVNPDLFQCGYSQRKVIE